ncbi:MAG: hypothetical protein HYV16_06785 [Gammaproteobacteria bacterium]|nr:hypothetical protein [Gammaproteobacteria bacterium]
MNHALNMDVQTPLSAAQRMSLRAELEDLLDQVRYDGLLPGSGLPGLGQPRPEADLLADALPLSAALVLERLHDMAQGLDCRAERAAYESLPDWVLPVEAEAPARDEPAAPPLPEALQPEAQVPPADDASVETLPTAEPVAPAPAAAVAVLSESLAEAEAEPVHEEQVQDVPSQCAEVECQPEAALPDNLDPFELAQTVTAQLMERLDEQLSSQFPPAVYDSFAEMYFQFSTKLCERLSEQEPQQLIRLMSQEAAR